MNFLLKIFSQIIFAKSGDTVINVSISEKFVQYPRILHHSSVGNSIEFFIVVDLRISREK